MRPWTFRAYVTPDGGCPIGDWYAQQEARVKAVFDDTRDKLRSEKDWLETDDLLFRPLQQKHIGLGEIRFHTIAINPINKRPFRRRFRPVGIWRPERHDFIFLLGCEKWGMNYCPKDAFDLALSYKALLEQGRGTVREYL